MFCQKSSVSLLLLTILLLFPLSPLASSDLLTMDNHTQIISQSIEDIRSIQQDTFLLFQNITSLSPIATPQLNEAINLIYAQIEDVQNTLLDYVTVVPPLTPERRDILFALISLNSAENSLYQLTRFTTETNSLARTLLLEDFYFLRTSTTQALNRLQNIISRE